MSKWLEKVSVRLNLIFAGWKYRQTFCDGCMLWDGTHEIRVASKERLGGNCTYVDDDLQVLCILAQRAVLANLHSTKDPKTRKHMEEAAEAHRANHESDLGYPIIRQEAP